MAALTERRPPFPTTVAGKIEIAKQYKDDGNALFCQMLFKKAIAKYSTALAFTKGLPGRTTGMDGITQMAASADSNLERVSADEEQEIVALEAVLKTNIATCHIKIGDGRKALEVIKDALQLTPNAWKSLLRQAEAWSLLGDHEKAISILDEAATHAQSDEKALMMISKSREKSVLGLKQAEQKQRKAFGRIFDSK